MFIKKVLLSIFALNIGSNLVANSKAELPTECVLCEKACKTCPVVGAYPPEICWTINEMKNDTLTCNRLLLYGSPGNGKTLIAKTIAYLTGSEFHYVNTASLVHYVGDGANNMKNEFIQAWKLIEGSTDKKVVIFFDEINTIAANTHRQGRDEHKSALTEFWTHIDKYQDNNRIFIICACNNIKNLDPYFTSRFNECTVKIKGPNQTERKSILEFYADKFEAKLEPQAINNIATNSDGASRRFLEGFVKTLVRWAKNDNNNIITKGMIEKRLSVLQKLIKKEQAAIKEEKREKRTQEMQSENIEIENQEKKIKQQEEDFLSKCIYDRSGGTSETILTDCSMQARQVREELRLHRKQNNTNKK